MAECCTFQSITATVWVLILLYCKSAPSPSDLGVLNCAAPTAYSRQMRAVIALIRAACGGRTTWSPQCAAQMLTPSTPSLGRPALCAPPQKAM